MKTLQISHDDVEPILKSAIWLDLGKYDTPNPPVPGGNLPEQGLLEKEVLVSACAIYGDELLGIADDLMISPKAVLGAFQAYCANLHYKARQKRIRRQTAVCAVLFLCVAVPLQRRNADRGKLDPVNISVATGYNSTSANTIVESLPTTDVSVDVNVSSSTTMDNEIELSPIPLTRPSPYMHHLDLTERIADWLIEKILPSHPNPPL